jgi:hypothetical protein
MPLKRIAVALVLVTMPARAEPTKAECAAAHREAQDLRRIGKLRASREKLIFCASDDCPRVVTSECIPWLAEVEQGVPRIVLEARFADGTDIVVAKILLDGELVAERLDGRAIPLDPGEHVIRIEPPGHAPMEKRIGVAVGETAKLVRFDEAPSERAPRLPRESRVRLPWAAIALGALGVAGVGGFGYFGLNGLSKEDRLADCSPACPPSRSDEVKTQYVVADVSLAVGVVALAAATIIALSTHAPVFDRSMLK